MATIGEAIDELVEKRGDSTIGIYILEEALRRALQSEGGIMVGGMLPQEHSRWLEIKEEEDRIMARLNER